MCLKFILRYLKCSNEPFANCFVSFSNFFNSVSVSSVISFRLWLFGWVVLPRLLCYLFLISYFLSLFDPLFFVFAFLLFWVESFLGNWFWEKSLLRLLYDNKKDLADLISQIYKVNSYVWTIILLDGRFAP